MKQKINKPASQEERILYCLMGEALCKTQIVEQALGHSITLKLNSDATKQKADASLVKQLRYTLGNAIKFAEKHQLLPFHLQSRLNSFLDKRNWLVHKAMSESINGIEYKVDTKGMFQKIKSISDDAEDLQHEIEVDLIDFCESKGRDMSASRAIVKVRYSDS